MRKARKAERRVRRLCKTSPAHPCSIQNTHLPMSPYTLEGGVKDMDKFTKGQQDGEETVEHDERQADSNDRMGSVKDISIKLECFLKVRDLQVNSNY